MKDVCVLVVSHNFGELTDKLCDEIVTNTKNVSYDLNVVETGSTLSKVSKYMTLWSKEKCRMTRGFNLLKNYADTTFPDRKYGAYQLFVNDASFVGGEDMISVLYEDMMSLPDCGQMHPYQTYSTPVHRIQNKQTDGQVRKESFCEFICPMLRAEAWNSIPDLLDNRFFYGWGLDYDIPYQLHLNGYRSYINDKVGVTHIPFTSYRNSEKTEETLSQQKFMDTARVNMVEGFVQKYGHGWKSKMIEAIPEDVRKTALLDWMGVNDGLQ